MMETCNRETSIKGMEGEKEVLVTFVWVTWAEFLYALLLVDGNLSEEGGCPRPNPWPGSSLSFDRLSHPTLADAKQAPQASDV